MGTEVQEVNYSVCLVLEVKDGLNNGTDIRVQGRDTQITVLTSPSSVITAAQRYTSDFPSQLVMIPECRSHGWKRIVITAAHNYTSGS